MLTRPSFEFLQPDFAAKDSMMRSGEIKSMVLTHKRYQQKNKETVLMMLFRCLKLYEALADVKSIMSLIIKQEKLFE
jgi:hypothetical protein